MFDERERLEGRRVDVAETNAGAAQPGAARQTADGGRLRGKDVQMLTVIDVFILSEKNSCVLTMDHDLRRLILMVAMVNSSDHVPERWH